MDQHATQVFGLARHDLDDQKKVTEAVRTIASRMHDIHTLKNCEEALGTRQEDVYRTLQYEKLWAI